MIAVQGRINQHGMAALALVLMLATSTTLLVTYTLRRSHDPAAHVTQRALEQARAALLGYAASYPDRINPQFGPGYLPCPAQNTRGVASSACASSTTTTLGLFPWHTLRTNDIRDGSGQSLWFALAQSFRNNPKTEPMNSDVNADLEVDGAAAVAVIIAPGEPLAEQFSQRFQPLQKRQFLESLNGDVDVTRFTSRSSTAEPFNDRLITLTRRDLLKVVEARVLGEVQQRLAAYAATHDRHYPWLLSFNDRAALPKKSGSAREGTLVYHYVKEDDDHSQREPFATDLELSWILHNPTIMRDDPDDLIPGECLHRSPCSSELAPLSALFLAGPAVCQWWSPSPQTPPSEVARCVYDHRQTVGTLEYDITVAFTILDEDGDIEVTGPDLTRVRTRQIRTTRLAEIATHADLDITIVMRVSDGGGLRGLAEIRIGPETSGVFNAGRIFYALDVSRGELPAWLVRNGWPEQVYVAWTEKTCMAQGSCLNVHRGDDARASVPKDIRALAVLAGAPLLDAPARGQAAALSAWFEFSPDAVGAGQTAFAVARERVDFNDRLRIVERIQ